jgi:hypothetical protein
MFAFVKRVRDLAVVLWGGRASQPDPIPINVPILTLTLPTPGHSLDLGGPLIAPDVEDAISIISTAIDSGPSTPRFSFCELPGDLDAIDTQSMAAENGSVHNNITTTKAETNTPSRFMTFITSFRLFEGTNNTVAPPPRRTHRKRYPAPVRVEEPHPLSVPGPGKVAIPWPLIGKHKGEKFVYFNKGVLAYLLWTYVLILRLQASCVWPDIHACLNLLLTLHVCKVANDLITYVIRFRTVSIDFGLSILLIVTFEVMALALVAIPILCNKYLYVPRPVLRLLTLISSAGRASGPGPNELVTTTITEDQDADTETDADSDSCATEQDEDDNNTTPTPHSNLHWSTAYVSTLSHTSLTPRQARGLHPLLRDAGSLETAAMFFTLEPNGIPTPRQAARHARIVTEGYVRDLKKAEKEAKRAEKKVKKEMKEMKKAKKDEARAAKRAEKEAQRAAKRADKEQKVRMRSLWR